GSCSRIRVTCCLMVILRVPPEKRPCRSVRISPSRFQSVASRTTATLSRSRCRDYDLPRLVAVRWRQRSLKWFVLQTLSGLTLGGVYALIALGYSLVYGVLRLINFAHGDIYMVGAVVAFWAARWFGWTQVADDQVGPLVMVAMLFIAVSACVGAGYT